MPEFWPEYRHTRALGLAHAAADGGGVGSVGRQEFAQLLAYFVCVPARISRLLMLTPRCWGSCHTCSDARCVPRQILHGDVAGAALNGPGDQRRRRARTSGVCCGECVARGGFHRRRGRGNLRCTGRASWGTPTAARLACRAVLGSTVLCVVVPPLPLHADSVLSIRLSGRSALSSTAAGSHSATPAPRWAAAAASRQGRIRSQPSWRRSTTRPRSSAHFVDSSMPSRLWRRPRGRLQSLPCLHPALQLTLRSIPSRSWRTCSLSRLWSRSMLRRRRRLPVAHPTPHRPTSRSNHRLLKQFRLPPLLMIRQQHWQQFQFLMRERIARRRMAWQQHLLQMLRHRLSERRWSWRRSWRPSASG